MNAKQQIQVEGGSHEHQTRLTAESALSRIVFSQFVPVVGVGASAGGLEAFTELLKHLPADTGLGFVFVQHLNPQRESALTHILSRTTSMPVCQAMNNLSVEVNRIYP